MTTSSTSLLGLALPVTGELNGTWGDVVNNSLTSLLDTAIAGTTTLSADLDVTLTTTALTANQARQAVLLCTGNRTSIKTITAPAQSKTYVVINATTGSPAYAVKIVGAGPTTGVTVAAGQAALVAWNGTDFTLVATTDASKLTGTLGVANGGTGQTTYTDGQLLIGNSTGNTLTKANLTAGTGVSITNGAGSISIANTAPDQTVTLTGAGATTTSGTYPNFTISSVNTTYGQATVSVDGLIKLGDATVQSVAANAVTATASRTYALQVNASGQGLVNVPWTDTTYTLPTATDSVLGGIKLGDATVQSVAANAVTATASRTYALQLNGSGQAVVNVPWTDTSSTAPGGSTTQVQYNNAGAFGGSANFTFDGTTVTTANDASISGLTVGKGAGSLDSNTAVGNGAFSSNTTGASNTAVGRLTLQLNLVGDNITAVGRGAAQHAKGSGNTALGAYALQGNFANATGLANVGVGVSALNNFTTATNNIAIGDAAMYGVSTATNSIGIGPSALSATSGDKNVAIGYESGKAITTGSNNVVIGGYTGSTAPISATGSNFIVLSDGAGNVRAYWNAANATFNGNLDTTGTITQNSVAVVTTTGTQTLSNKTLTSPALGTPVSGNFSTGTFTWPTFNQNTTGSAASATTATNIAGGTANQIPYNTGAGATSFITAPTTATTFLTWNGSAFTWSNVAPSGSTFATDISVNTLTVGKGPNNPTGATTFGYQAGAAATASNVQQTAIGYRALATSTATAGSAFDWEGSTAIGYKALQSSNPTIQSYNTAVGAGALLSLTTGGQNTAVGNGAARSMTVGSSGVAIGSLAAQSAINGGFVAVGQAAANSATTQMSGMVAVGQESLYYATTNSGNATIYNRRNTGVGHQTLYFLDAESTGVGGSENTALGYLAGRNLVSGSNNTIVGNNAQASTTTVSNEITLGNSSITTLRCQVTSITSLSDQRDKYDIEDLPLGLSFVNALRPRRYKWDKRDWYVDEVQHEDGTVETVTVPKDGSRAQTNWNEGFVAQEAKAALQAAGADWFPLVYESNPEKLEMSSGKLIPVLVKAIQELTARIEALEAK